ncbi:MAG TPA: SpoIID/LytB domain-containing protein [Solirubrobacteraceae bacterium]|nr:SpoIID/LytB domain-containing protein [Solirubrobacteraceae bacterium]
MLALATPALAASELFIRGAGYGHGVGMSQYGAYGYALHGWDYRAILRHYYTGTALGAVDPHGTVTVLLRTGSGAFTGATRAADKKLRPAHTYYVRPLAGGRLRLLDQSGKLVGSFAAPLTATGPGPLSVPGLGPYRGALEFRPGGSGRVETIDVVGLDDYVRGVVASEMPSGWSMQALEAQAVAARTYAITTDAGGSGFDQYSDTRSQVYGGVRAETPRSDAAVAATRGQVVTYRGRPAVTYFFSSSGGRTENNENVFSGSPDPWLRGVGDPYDGAGSNPNFRWFVHMDGARAASKLSSLLSGGLVGIATLGHGVSPRITTAEVVGGQGAHRVSGAELEQRFGLKSTWAGFTTITTVARPHLARTMSARARATSARARAAELAMPLSLVRAVLAHVAPIPELAGTVFPGARGAPFVVQGRRGTGWRTLGWGKLDRGGAYSLTAPRHGTYRIVYQGLYGPAVKL